MARVDLWLDDLPELGDPAERRLSLQRALSHAGAAAEVYEGTDVRALDPWRAAEARLAEAVALAALAELGDGEDREEHVERALEACQAACQQLGAGEQAQLSLAAGIWAGCAQVLLQVHALSAASPERREAIEGLVSVLGEATGEALLWDRTYRQQGRDAMDAAQVAQAVADLAEDPHERAAALDAFHETALIAGAYLQQTGDREATEQAYALIRAARDALPPAPAAAAVRCPECGGEQPPGARFCTACGRPLAAEQTLPGSALLVVCEGPDAGKCYPLHQRLSIGRAPDNDVVLAIQLVSRHHAELRRVDEGCEIVDLGSSNGTRVNGLRVERSVLHDGDTITIGGLELTIQSAGPAAPPVTCPSCGQAVPAGDAFCGQCGTRVT
jgi:hypothetical protein